MPKSHAGARAWIADVAAAARCRDLPTLAQAVGLTLEPLPFRARARRIGASLLYDATECGAWQRAFFSREIARYALERFGVADPTAAAVDELAVTVRLIARAGASSGPALAAAESSRERKKPVSQSRLRLGLS